jgi:hypothetical protein
MIRGLGRGHATATRCRARQGRTAQGTRTTDEGVAHRTRATPSGRTEGRGAIDVDAAWSWDHHEGGLGG